MPVRALFTALIVCVFIHFGTNVFAQNAGDSLDKSSIDEPTVEIPAPDPITAAEQALIIGEAETSTAMPVSAFSVFGILRVLLTLAVAAAAIYGLVYFLKFKWFSRGKGEQDPFLKVLASVPLGTSRGAHIISVGSQMWLVGSAENGVNLISEITDKDIINAMLLEDSRKIGASNEGASAKRLLDFKTILGKLGFTAKTETSGPEKIRERSERLKGL